MTLPPLTITKDDRNRLVSTALAALGSGRAGQAATMLLSEVARARIVAEESLPEQVVAVQSEVAVRDNITNTSRRLRLVCPEDAVLDNNSVSVLTPLGASLIGLSVGEQLDGLVHCYPRPTLHYSAWHMEEWICQVRNLLEKE